MKSTWQRTASLWIVSVVQACRPLTSHLLFNHLYIRLRPLGCQVTDRWIKETRPHGAELKGAYGTNGPSSNGYVQWLMLVYGSLFIHNVW